jgi:hypothetical protein
MKEDGKLDGICVGRETGIAGVVFLEHESV